MNVLDELVAGTEGEHGDWEDVLRRAGVRRAIEPAPPPVRRRRRRAIAVLALVVALLVALFATPAFGLRDAVLDLIGRKDVTFSKAERAPARVVRQFEELGLGAPPRMASQAIAGQARRVATFRIRGRNRVLWVAPTRRGGFCYLFEGAFGGCGRFRPGQRILPVSLTYVGGARLGGPVEISQVGGTVLSERITRLTVEFGDGHEVDVPFVYVSRPIAAGFFVYDVPADRRREARGPRAVVARAANGDVLFRSGYFKYRPLRTVQPAPVQHPRPLPPRPSVEPTPPFQRATANGVSIVAGRNGAVMFDTSGAPEPLSRLLREGPVDWSCFRFRYGDARGYGIMGRYGRRAAVRFFGVGTPFDGCEIRGSYGHRWPDRFGSHAAVEVAFTPGARRYFEDRAAARQLALLVRTREVQRVRRLRGAALARGLRAFEPSLVRTRRPPPGRIGWWARGDTIVFSRLSTTGRRFEVEVRRGKVLRQNVRPLAFVF